MSITVSPATKRKFIVSIKKFYDEKMDDEVGELKADLLLDYFLKEIGPTVYNLAVADAQSYFQEKTQDLDGSCYQREFGYWK